MLASNFSIVQTAIYSPTKVSNYLNLSDIPLHLAVCLFDRTLANTELDEKQLQLTAITCLLLASKVLLMTAMEMTTLSIMRMVMNEPRSMFASKDLCFFSGGGRLCTCPLPLAAFAGRLPRGEGVDRLGDEDEDGGDGEDGEDDPQGSQLSPQDLHCSHLSSLLHTGKNVCVLKKLRKKAKSGLVIGQVLTIPSSQLLPQEARRVGRLAKAILDLSLLSPW